MIKVKLEALVQQQQDSTIPITLLLFPSKDTPGYVDIDTNLTVDELKWLIYHVDHPE